MIKKTKHGYEFSWENWNSIQKALLDESETVGDKETPDDIDKTLFNNLSNSFLGSDQLLAAEFITDEEQIKQDLLCYLISKDNAPIDVAYGVEIIKVEKEYYPHAVFHINCEADWNATSIWEHQETYQVAKQVTVYVDYLGREHDFNGGDREITKNGSVYRERKPFSKTVYEDKKRVVTDNVQQTSGHIGPWEYVGRICMVTSEIADTVMKWADNYASDKIIEVNDEYFSNYKRISDNLTSDEAEDKAVKKAFAELKNLVRFDVPGNRYERLTLSGHDIRGIKRQFLFLSVYHVFYKYNGKQFDCYMSADGCKDDVIVSDYPTEASIDEKHIRFKEKIEKKKKSHSKWRTSSYVLFGVGILLVLISLFGGGSSWGIAALVAFLIGAIYYYLCQRDKKEIARIEESLRSFDDNNSKLKEKIYSIIQDDSLNEEERKKTVKEFVDNTFLDNDTEKINKSENIAKSFTRLIKHHRTDAEQVRSVAYENKKGQSTKGFFFKNGKINILGWACVIGPVLAIAVILSIIVGVNTKNKNSLEESAIKVETENISKKVEKERKYDKNESLSDYSEKAKEGGLPEDVYEDVKGTYNASINFITCRVISPDTIIMSNGEDETIRIEKYEYIGDELVMYVDSGSIISYVKGSDGTPCLLLREGGGWDYEMTHVYSSLGKISDNISISESEINKEYKSTRYYVSGADLLKIKKEGAIYLSPTGEDSCFYSVDDGTLKPFTQKIKIAKDAKIGIATNLITPRNGDTEVFLREYFDFYDEIDNLFSTEHWIFDNSGNLCFEAEGQTIPLHSIVSFNNSGEIDLFLESCQTVANTSSEDDKGNDAWYGQGLQDGASEGGLPSDSYEILKGTYSDKYRKAEIISTTEVKFTYYDEDSSIWNIEYSDALDDNTVIMFLSCGPEQMSVTIDKGSKGIALHILRGVWEYNFDPEMTLYKE